MKKMLLTLAVIMSICQAVSAQTLKELFGSSDFPLLYLGVDFTQLRVLNEVAPDPAAIKDRQFAGINQLVLAEPKKFKVAEVFQRAEFNNDLSFVTARNATVDASKIIGTDEKDERLSKSDIEAAVKNYDFSGKKGIGLLFVAETYNKASLTGSYYVTLIDMGSKKVLLTERLTGKPAGFGFRNYWAKTLHDVILQIQKTKYKEWQKANS